MGVLKTQAVFPRDAAVPRLGRAGAANALAASASAATAVGSPFIVPLIIGCWFFLQMLDSTIIATALPAMARSLREDPIRLNLAITSYMLSLALFVPISGWIADRFGARSVFRAAIVWFTIGSIFCGLAQSLPELVVARVLQGFGGAMMMPVGRLIVLKTVSKSDYVQAMSYLTVPSMLGPIIGPPLGGFIVTYYSWRWIFFINLPICVLGIVLVTLFVPNIYERTVRRLDLPGFLLTGFGLAGMVFSFESIGRGVISPAMVTSLMVGGIGCAGLYVVHARRIAHPIIDLNLFRVRTFTAANSSAGGLYRIGLGGLSFLLALQLQLGLGYSPFSSGLLILASAAGSLAMKFAINPIVRRFGFRSVLMVNGVLVALSVSACALFTHATPRALIVFVLFEGGFFQSLQFTSLNALAYADISADSMSGASSLGSMLQQLFNGLGVIVAAQILHITLALHGETTLTAHDISPAFLIAGIVALISVFFLLPLEHHAGAEVSGHVPVRMPALEPEQLAMSD
jgi:EmrB/QacA subfamily drug resistance transporter